MFGSPFPASATASLLKEGPLFCHLNAVCGGAECYRTVNQNATTPVQPLLLEEHKVLKLIFCASVSMSIETEVLLAL